MTTEKTRDAVDHAGRINAAESEGAKGEERQKEQVSRVRQVIRWTERTFES